jgi:membrane protease YdiL (CAAX protease family)
MPTEPALQRHIVWIAVLFEGALAFLAAGLGWALAQRPLETFHWSAGDLALGAAACLPLLVVFVLCTRLPLRPLRRIRRLCDELVRPLFAACSFSDLAAIALMAGIGEELLFRGVLQAVLSRWFGLWPGVAVASVLFGLLHLITPTYAVMVTLMGAYLGCVWLASENLLTVIVAHAVYDFLALLYLIHGPGPATAPSPDSDEPEPGSPT